MIVVQKDENLCQIIDFAYPYDERVDTKDLVKSKHYKDLARELRKIWDMIGDMSGIIIPLMIGSLRTTLIKLRIWLKEIGY